jgi:hypothetical protein
MRGLNFTRRRAPGLVAGAGVALLTDSVFPAHALAATAQTNSRFSVLQQAIQGAVVPKGSADCEAMRAAMVWNRRVAQVLDFSASRRATT